MGFDPSALEFAPDLRLTYADQLGASGVRFSIQFRADGERFESVPQRDVDFLHLNLRAQLISETDDQALSPYIAFVPRWAFLPFYSAELENRQDFNLGLQKRFNFDGAFRRLPQGASTTAHPGWSLGFDILGQRRHQDPGPASFALIAAPSASYAISPDWGISAVLLMTGRQFDDRNGPVGRQLTVEPILTLEYTLPARWFDGNPDQFGNPAISFQAAGERRFTDASGSGFDAVYVGVSLKTGYAFRLCCQDGCMDGVDCDSAMPPERTSMSAMW